jgi:antitoxin component HigA of HigAB toxin-antitoxin module
MKRITNEKQYRKALEDIYQSMNKNEENITDAEAGRIHAKALQIQAYDKKYYPFPMPETIIEIVEMKMIEKKMTRAKLAVLLNIGTAKLSQILNGKRKPDILFLKAIHEKLNVDGNLLLEKV